MCRLEARIFGSPPWVWLETMQGFPASFFYAASKEPFPQEFFSRTPAEAAADPQDSTAYFR